MEKDFGSWLQQHRERADLTQQDLGARIGVSQQSIAKWESGKALPRPKVLRQLSEVLGAEYNAAVDAKFNSVRARSMAQDEQDDFSKRLGDLRLASGMTLAAVGEQIGVSPQAVHKWEDGGQVEPARITHLADLFGANPSWLLFGQGDAPAGLNDRLSALSKPADFMHAVFVNRRSRLAELVKQHADGNAAKFAEKLGYSRAQMHQFLSETYNDGRSIGEAAARNIEERASLPGGWLDQPADNSLSNSRDDASASPISTGRESEQSALRLPDGMRDAVKEMARSGHRTMNAQMVYLIQRGIEAEQGNAGSDLTALLRQSAGLMNRIAEELDAKPRNGHDR